MATADFSCPAPGHLSNMFMNDFPSIDDLLDLYTDEDMLLPDNESFSKPCPTVSEPPKPLAAPVSPDHVPSTPKNVPLVAAAPIAPLPTLFPTGMILPPPMLGVQNVFYAPSIPFFSKPVQLMKPDSTPPIKIGKECSVKPKNDVQSPSEQPDTTSPTRKRRRSSASGGPTRVYTEKQKVERRERNRQHAKKSRSRKKTLTESLRQCLDDLKDENENIRSQLYEKFGEVEIKSIIKQKMATPSDHFVTALKNPQNKTVNDETLTLLKQLSKKVQNKKSKS